MSDIPVIAVDGPSGTGKGTICSHLANWLGWHLLDSGALYRIVAVAAEKHQLEPKNESAIADIAGSLDVVFQQSQPGKDITVIFEGDDISQKIRTEACGNSASQIAILPQVRSALLDRETSTSSPIFTSTSPFSSKNCEIGMSPSDLSPALTTTVS